MAALMLINDPDVRSSLVSRLIESIFERERHLMIGMDMLLPAMSGAKISAAFARYFSTVSVNR
jgi:hypothetical protein